MVARSVLLIGKSTPELASQFGRRGMQLIAADALGGDDAAISSHSVIIVPAHCIDDELGARLLRMRKSTVVALMLAPDAPIPPSLVPAVEAGRFECCYDHELSTGLVVQHVETMLRARQARYHSRLLESAVRERQILKRDLSLHEKAVDHERLLNASIIASITSGLLILDISGLIVLVNEHAQGLLRISSSKLVGRHYKVAMPRKISSAIRRIIDSATGATGRTTIKKVKINQDFLQITGFRVVKGKDESSGFLLFVQDVTEQELAAQQLYRAEKLATIGTMLSGISHELRNPLSIISARCQRALQKQTWDHDWIVAALESIQHQTHRCATIVNNLLDFTRHTATMPAYHKIGEIIEETLTYVAYHGIFNSIKVEKRYEESQEVFGDRSRIVQALLNVITNAVDAMERAGILRISARLRQPHWVIVEVNDTGPGIDPAIQDVIFDPFFTTKDPGKGTGLGLAIAQRIIEESNGEIWLMSEPGNTSFFIKLPSLREGVNARTNSAG